MDVSKNRKTPQDEWFIMEKTLLEWMIWGLPLFLETPKNQYTKFTSPPNDVDGGIFLEVCTLGPTMELKILRFVLRTKDALEENTQDLCEGNDGSIYTFKIKKLFLNPTRV